ncbi:MAG TPA: hypothetical protein VJ719_14420 [Chthoniobacterales bacterium]|nr:hypothetical protein [Chthoniobacterales bacterium]
MALDVMRVAKNYRNSSVRRLAAPLLIAAITVAGFDRFLGVVANILSQGSADIVTLGKASFRAATHISLVGPGVD